MEFLLLDQELSEAKIFRNTASFRTTTGRDVANLLYLYTLSLYLLSQDKAEKFARREATRTAQYNNYALFRTHGTDMYMLAYQLLRPDNDYGDIKEPITSKRFLNRLRFDDKAHINFLKLLQQGSVDEKRAAPYLYRLENQLQISDTRYKSWRRVITVWAGLNNKDKQKILTPLVLELRRKGGGAARNTNILNQLELLRPKRTRIYRPRWAKDTYDTVPGKAS